MFIGEAALTMIQNVDYEVPYLRKQMAKCSQQMADAERRHAEYVRSAAQCATNYKKVRGALLGAHGPHGMQLSTAPLNPGRQGPFRGSRAGDLLTTCGPRLAQPACHAALQPYCCEAVTQCLLPAGSAA